MPSGKAHLAVELLTLPAWVAAGTTLGLGQEPLTLFALTYVVSSVWLSPDLDLAHSRPARRWGPLRWLWLPYSWAFRHRGLSHAPLWGPLTRLAYLALLGGLLGVLVRTLFPMDLAPAFVQELTWERGMACAAGFFLPQLLHVLMDALSTKTKRAWHARR